MPEKKITKAEKPNRPEFWRAILDQLNPRALTIPELDKAIVGLASHNGLFCLAYDYDKAVQCLVEDRDSWESACRALAEKLEALDEQAGDAPVILHTNLDTL